MVSPKELRRLKDIIIENLKKEFEVKHLSKNLINTIYVEEVNGEIRINIPAKTYDILTYKKKGVIIYTGKGSYAEKLNKEGSHYYSQSKASIGNHKGFIDRIINISIQMWLEENRNKYIMLSKE